jgi:folate-dependent phosphoribosylglycinamide formyltransferase PurN
MLRPLRVAVLCSHRAPGLLYLLNQSPDRGVAFEIVCCLTSETTFAEEVRVERRGVPTIVHPLHDFYAAQGGARIADMHVRARYDAETIRLIEPYFPDVVVLDGYLYVVTDVLMNAFPSRIINLHFSDLTFRRRDGGPMFPGIRAVRDTIAAGCHETRATVHLVDAEPDAGAPIVRSWPFPVSPLVEELRAQNAAEVLKAYVFAHEQWMMRTVSGPLLAAGLRLLAAHMPAPALLQAAMPGDCPWLLEHDHTLVPESDHVAH